MKYFKDGKIVCVRRSEDRVFMAKQRGTRASGLFEGCKRDKGSS